MANLITYNSPYLNSLNITEAEVGTAVAAIKAASEAIERYCNRRFALANYSQLLNTTQDGYAVLRNFPVAYLSGVYDHLEDVLDVENTGAGVTNAAVYTSADSLTLTHTAGGTVSSTTLSYADYPTATTMAAAVVALGSGWTATTVEDYATYPTALIWEGQHIDATAGGGCVQAWENGGIEVVVDFENGIVKHLPRYSRIRIDYRAGFATIPEPIQQVTANLVGNMFDEKHRGIISERLGDYNYTLSATAFDRMPIQDRQILDLYRDRRV